MKKYFFPDAKYADAFFGGEEPCCVDLNELSRLAEGWGMLFSDLLLEMHTASSEEIEKFGISEGSDSEAPFEMKTNRFPAGEYSFKELADRALSPDAKQIDLDTLGAWCERYLNSNGECFSIDEKNDAFLYPIVVWDEETDCGDIVAYCFGNPDKLF